MDILGRIIELKNERGWSSYRLAKEANIPQSTLTNLIKHNNLPTIPTLKAMCDAFGITLLKFFEGKDSSFMTSDQNELINDWSLLTSTHKEIVRTVIKGLLIKQS